MQAIAGFQFRGPYLLLEALRGAVSDVSFQLEAVAQVVLGAVVFVVGFRISSVA